MASMNMSRSIILSVFAILISGTSASAQTDAARKVEARLVAAANKIEAACGADVKKYCSTITPGEGRLVFCILANEDKISTKCDYALYEASRKLERALSRIEQAADACWNDIEKYCANIPDGGGRIAQCLAAKKASLTKSCQTAVGKFLVAK